MASFGSGGSCYYLIGASIWNVTLIEQRDNCVFGSERRRYSRHGWCPSFSHMECFSDVTAMGKKICGGGLQTALDAAPSRRTPRGREGGSNGESSRASTSWADRLPAPQRHRLVSSASIPEAIVLIPEPPLSSPRHLRSRRRRALAPGAAPAAGRCASKRPSRASSARGGTAPGSTRPLRLVAHPGASLPACWLPNHCRCCALCRQQLRRLEPLSHESDV